MCSDKKTVTQMKDDYKYISDLLDKISDEGIKNYLAHELYTYAERTRFYKYCHYIFSIISLSAPALAIVVNNLGSGTTLGETLVSVFAAVATIATGTAGIFKFKETWIRYRSYCEMLKRDVTEYVNNLSEYADASMTEKDKMDKFYDNIRKRIEKEEQEWRDLRNSV